MIEKHDERAEYWRSQLAQASFELACLGILMSETVDAVMEQYRDAEGGMESK